MPHQLIVTRHQSAADDAAMLEQFDTVEAVGFRWNLASFGLERLEVTVKANNKWDAYDRYNKHLGQRIAICSSWGYRPMSGFVSQIELLGSNRVKYVARGVEWMASQQYDQTVTGTGGTVTSRLQDNLNNILSGFSIIENSYTNIDTNSTDPKAWSPLLPTGTDRATVIKELIEMSDSSGNIWDFWCIDEPFTGAALNQYIPYFKSRSTSATADWIVNLDDLSTINVARHINDVVNDVEIYYGAFSGTTTGGNATTLTDGTATFLTSGIAPGDRCYQNTDQEQAIVVTVDSATQITTTTLTGGATWNTKAYAIQRDNPQTIHTAGGTTTTAARWIVSRHEEQITMDSTQAGYYASYLLDDGPQQMQSFTISSPHIKHSSGALYPLWEVAIKGGGYIQIADLYPAAAMFTTSLNKLTSFKITALDYDYTRRALSVHVDTLDKRLDARLKAAGILGSEAIARG